VFVKIVWSREERKNNDGKWLIPYLLITALFCAGKL
jgi:hypothetical protein